MSQSYLSVRFEKIRERFDEVNVLINLAQDSVENEKKYIALCRSAHVLLVSHFEGIYKEVCKDTLDDISINTVFSNIPLVIVNTHLNYFIQNLDNEKSAKAIKVKLAVEFELCTVKLKAEPFLHIDNRNPTPDIIEKILERFGVKNFFWSLEGSDLDVAFQDSKLATEQLRDNLSAYLIQNTREFPYSVNRDYYHPLDKSNVPKKKTLWEDFINNLLKDRHSIVHGTNMASPLTHEELSEVRLKIEIITLAYIANMCCAATPVNSIMSVAASS